MKIVPLSEAKAKLSRYGQMCHKQPVVITVNGRPSFQLVPLEEGDDLIDRLLEEHPGFRGMLEERLGGRVMQAGEAAQRLSAKRAEPVRSGRKRAVR